MVSEVDGMKVRDVMTKSVIRIDPGESAEVAARTFTHYNIGVLPVCTGDGSLCGVVTDRDLVTRCVALGRTPAQTTVREIMTNTVRTAQPDMEVNVAAHLMGSKQIRRLPVVEDGKLCGMLSLGDLAKRDESAMDATDALADISANLSSGGDW